MPLWTRHRGTAHPYLHFAWGYPHLGVYFHKVTLMIPGCLMPGIVTLLIVVSVCCGCPANNHHAHTCISICPTCRQAQVLPLDWLSTCTKVTAHTFFPIFCSFSLCVCVSHMQTHTRGAVNFNCPSICPFVFGNSLWFQAQHFNDDVCAHSLIPSSASLLLLSRVSL